MWRIEWGWDVDMKRCIAWDGLEGDQGLPGHGEPRGGVGVKQQEVGLYRNDNIYMWNMLV